MATLVLARDLVDDLHKLEPPVRTKVLDLPAKFAEHTHSGAHLEKLRAAVDPNVRTVRVDKFWRGVVFYPGTGDTYALIRVLGHDDAIAWASKVRFQVNPLSGAFEIINIDSITAPEPTPAATESAYIPAPADVAGVLEHITDADLVTVGVNELVIPLLRTITDRAQLDALVDQFPQSQAAAIQLLVDGATIDEVLELFTTPDEPVRAVDTTDFETALRSDASAGDFAIYSTDDDLTAWLEDSFDLWKVFLHPTQAAFATKDTFNGPAKLTGIAGTGKTVAALHRAQFLAARAEANRETGTRILLTTYTRALATELERRVTMLCTPAESKRIDVINIDRYASMTVAGATGARGNLVLDRDALEARWQAAIDHVSQSGQQISAQVTPAFLNAEWNAVILGGVDGVGPLATAADYLTAPRPGRGSRLSRGERRGVWEVVEDFTATLAANNERAIYQQANAAAAILDAQAVRPYRHVIVDEAQDFHPAQWRVARAAVRAVGATLANDMFIVGDAHQRIYGSPTPLSRFDINTRGRARRLRLNYRTSHQIHRWSLAIRDNTPVDDLDAETDTSDGSYSAFTGPEPTFAGYASAQAEADAAAATVAEWLGTTPGLRPHDIAVVARSRQALERVGRALDADNIRHHRLSDDTVAPDNHVAVGTMHGVKGGEYRNVLIVDVSAGQVPSIHVTPEAADPVAHANELANERNLLYVAATRARERLRITWNGTPSRFLVSSDVPPEVAEGRKG